MAVTPSNGLGGKKDMQQENRVLPLYLYWKPIARGEESSPPQSEVEKPTYNSCLIVMLTIPDNDELCHRMSTLYRPTQICESHMVALNLSAGMY